MQIGQLLLVIFRLNFLAKFLCTPIPLNGLKYFENIWLRQVGLSHARRTTLCFVLF